MNRTGQLIDRTGQRFNDFVITKELGHGKVMAKCFLCGEEKEYGKGVIVHGYKKNCGCQGNNHIKNYEGKTFGNFQIIKELGHSKVLARCLLCGREKEYWKQAVVEGYMKSDGCQNAGLRDYTGKTFNHVQVVKELGNNRIIGKCLLCGKVREFNKFLVIHGKTKSCGCIRRRRSKLNDSI